MASVSKTYLARVYPLEEVHRFIKDCMLALGVSEVNSEDIAACLVEADYRGHSTAGLFRLVSYIDEIASGGCKKQAVPKIIKESPSTALVDGQNGLGVVVGNFCMNLAMRKAKTIGIGWVVAKGSNYFGNASYYSLQATKHDLIGMSFSNNSPIVAPPNAHERVIGTNPMSLAAPGFRDDSFVLDMSTSVVPVGKIEMLDQQFMTIPPDWANTETGAIYPIGGKDPELNYKGFGLGMMVEVICGILSGSAFGPYVRRYGDVNQVANFGQCFVAINPSFFALGFEQRLSDFMNMIRNLESTDPDTPVMVPGDRSRRHMAKVDSEGGVHYSKDLIDDCAALAERFNITPMRHS